MIWNDEFETLSRATSSGSSPNPVSADEPICGSEVKAQRVIDKRKS